MSPHNTATLTLTGHTDNWSLKRTTPTIGTCTTKTGTYTHNLTNLNASTTYTYTAYSDSLCSTTIDSTALTTRTAPALTASDVTHNTATLTLTGHTGNWWIKQTAPTSTTCTAKTSTTTHSLTNLTANRSYTYTAYTNSGCTTTIDSASFTTPHAPALTASDVTHNTATLTLTGHTGNWSLKTHRPNNRNLHNQDRHLHPQPHQPQRLNHIHLHRIFRLALLNHHRQHSPHNTTRTWRNHTRRNHTRRNHTTSGDAAHPTGVHRHRRQHPPHSYSRHSRSRHHQRLQHRWHLVLPRPARHQRPNGSFPRTRLETGHTPQHQPVHRCRPRQHPPHSYSRHSRSRHHQRLQHRWHLVLPRPARHQRPNGSFPRTRLETGHTPQHQPVHRCRPRQHPPHSYSRHKQKQASPEAATPLAPCSAPTSPSPETKWQLSSHARSNSELPPTPPPGLSNAVRQDSAGGAQGDPPPRPVECRLRVLSVAEEVELPGTVDRCRRR